MASRSARAKASVVSIGTDHPAPWIARQLEAARCLFGSRRVVIEVHTERATNDRTTESAVQRETAEKREQGRLDLCGDAGLCGLLRYPRPRQGPRHRRRAGVCELVHGTRRRHPQTAGQVRPASAHRERGGRRGDRAPVRTHELKAGVTEWGGGVTFPFRSPRETTSR